MSGRAPAISAILIATTISAQSSAFDIGASSNQSSDVDHAIDAYFECQKMAIERLRGTGTAVDVLVGEIMVDCSSQRDGLRHGFEAAVPNKTPDGTIIDERTKENLVGDAMRRNDIMTRRGLRSLLTNGSDRGPLWPEWR